MSARVLAVFVLVLVAVGFAPRDAAAGKTWCVSAFEPGPGYDGAGPIGTQTQRDPCADSCFKGSSWHFHGFVKKGGKCYSCWDESDNTCQDTADDEGYLWIGIYGCSGTPIAGYGDSDNGCYPDKPPAPKQDVVTSQADPVAQPPVADVMPAKKTLPTPPKPRPTDYDGVIVKVSPGPYAVNTPITAVGGAQTRAGKQPRRVQAGTFVVVGPDGQPLVHGGQPLRFHGKAKGRHVVATVTIPPGLGSTFTLRFEPKAIVPASTETVADVAPAEQALAVAACRVQAVLDAPTAGEILVADADAALRGHLVDSAGQPAPASALGGARAVFVVEVAGQEQRLDATVDAAGVATASVRLAKPPSDVEAVQVRLVADGGQGDVCPSAPAEAKTTALGLGIEIKPDAPRCYVDRPCPVTARFVLPKDPTARAVGEAFLRGAGLTLTAAAGGPAATLTADRPGAVDAVWKGVVTPGDTGLIPLVAVARSAGGEVEDQAIVDIMEPIELKLEPVVDLGTVAAGTASNARCRLLSFATSRGVVHQQFRLTATRPAGCDSYPVFFDGNSGVGYPLHGDGVTLELDHTRGPDGAAQQELLGVWICLAAVPRCAAESPAPAILTVAALSPDFPDQKATVEIRWKVTGRNFLACWWWLIAAIGGGLLVLVVGYGFVRPWRFAVDDQVQLAGKREQLARAVGRRLRDLPGGRPGWYRSAAVGLLDSGQATTKLGTALVELHAKKGEVIIRSRGGLERVSPQTKKLVPVPEAASKDGHVASKNVVYSAGSLFFQLK